jgi:dTDP-4-amino-4,6-dideoxygalactose transaminase
MTKEKIWLSSPHMGGEEIKFVNEAFATNWISPVGPHITGFEQDISSYNSIEHCAALSSGTAAIHLALIILGVKSGDEVICSSFTFSATANPIVYQQATPVFVDSERETWNMDPVLLEKAIKERIAKGKKPKAIVVVHLYGMPAHIEAIMSVARRYDIPVVEDAAEALGSDVNGKRLGTFGDFGVYSFNGNKIITTSGGGALVSSNKAWIEKTKFLATQARDPAPHYEHSEIGFNYRLSNVCAGIGRGQMIALPERVAQRRSIFEFYRSSLSDIPGITFVPEPPGYFSNRWLSTILVNTKAGGLDREKIRLALEQQNVESRPLWKPMHMQPVFSSFPAYTNGVSEDLFEHGLCLPSGSNMTNEQQKSVVEIISHLSHK